MNDWVDDLQDEIAKLKAENKRLKAANKKLRKENKELKARPVNPMIPYLPDYYGKGETNPPDYLKPPYIVTVTF